MYNLNIEASTGSLHAGLKGRTLHDSDMKMG